VLQSQVAEAERSSTTEWLGRSLGLGGPWGSLVGILPPSLNVSIPRVQIQEITVRVNDLYTPRFTLPTNFSPTHQPTYFCLISRNTYILTQNLNPMNTYIERQRK
jgi:hypothetical protein